MAVLISCLAIANAAEAQAIPDPHRPTADPERSDSSEALEAALARYAFEPTVEATVEATLAHAAAPRAAALADRARSAGLVPRLSVRVRRGQTLDLSNPQNDDALRVKSNDDLTLEGTLSFELDRLVFRSEEVALMRGEAVEHERRALLVRQVIHWYFERRRLQVERDLDPLADVARSMRIAELTALLDSMTGGLFASHHDKRVHREPR